MRTYNKRIKITVRSIIGVFKKMDEQSTSGDHSSYFAPLHTLTKGTTYVYTEINK